MAVPFVGPSYLLDTRTADVQRSVNLYPAPIESGSGKAAFMLKSIPGLVEFASIGNEGRGAYEINGRAWVVVDDTLYEVFTDGTTADRGSLLTSTGFVSIKSNTTQLFLVDGDNAYVMPLDTNLLSRVTDPDFPGSDLTEYLDQYAIFAPADGQSFSITALGDATTIDALDSASSEASPDNLVGFAVINRELWLLGRESGEVWFNSGNSEFPLERNNGSIFGVGCAGKWTIKPFNNTIAWVGADKSGGNGVWMAAGYQAQRISNRSVEQAIAACTDMDHAIAYTQRIDGSVFYCLQLPGVDTTWCYDALTGAWHERADWTLGEYAQHRVSWYFRAFGKDLGLSTDGVLYQWDKEAFDNAGDPLVRDRISPHNAVPANDPIFYTDFRLDLDTEFAGIVTLRYSNDGGATWGSWDERNLGGIGGYMSRVRWLRCGSAMDRVWHVRCTDAVPFNPVSAIVNATR